MIENDRSGIWKMFMANPEIRPAVDQIGPDQKAAAGKGWYLSFASNRIHPARGERAGCGGGQVVPRMISSGSTVICFGPPASLGQVGTGNAAENRFRCDLAHLAQGLSHGGQPRI
jgi:hypothetical protein